MTVETYSRLAYGPTNSAERLVLQRVRSVIERRGEDAVILVNLLHGRHEIGLIVATQTATLVIEVKGCLQLVEGDINGRSRRTVATGERRSNFYAKIDSAHMDLKDALRAMTRADPGYAQAVVLLAYGRPMGTNLPESDHRVTITEIEALDALLSTQVWSGTLGRLWGLDGVCRFAERKGRADAKAARRGRIERARGDRGESSTALLEAREANLQVRTARSSQPVPTAPLPRELTVWGERTRFRDVGEIARSLSGL